ncbi:MAG: FkbM family methyltransferase [Vicinamibacterales bacterium]
MSEPRIGREHVVWAYRLLLDRDPEGEQAIEPKLRAWRTTQELRRDILASEEFRLKNPDAAGHGGPALVIKPLGGARLWIDLADQVIGLPILRDGYERAAAALAVSLVRPGDTAVDVGAHIGFFALQLADAVGERGRVHAFEPLERNADLLERSIAESGFAGRLQLHRAAVSDQTGEALLRFARETLNTGGAFLAAAHDAAEGLATARVPTVRLDDAGLRRPVRFLKMDVEGAEPQVVRGARRLLAEDRPFVLSEVHPEQLQRVSGTTPAAFLAEMAALGYGVHAVDDGRVGAPMDPAAIDRVETVVLVPR